MEHLNSHVVGGFHRAVVEEILVAPLRILVVLFERVVPEPARPNAAVGILQLRTIATRMCRGGVEWSGVATTVGLAVRCHKCLATRPEVLPSSAVGSTGGRSLLSATAQCAAENRGSRRSKAAAVRSC